MRISLKDINIKHRMKLDQHAQHPGSMSKSSFLAKSLTWHRIYIICIYIYICIKSHSKHCVETGETSVLLSRILQGVTIVRCSIKGYLQVIPKRLLKLLLRSR